jgi:hypothetical protein
MEYSRQNIQTDVDSQEMDAPDESKLPELKKNKSTKYMKGSDTRLWLGQSLRGR